MLKPIGKRVLVKIIDEVQKTKSGIILKDNSTKQEIIKAKVLEVSDEIDNIKKDDTIYFSEYRVEKIVFDEIEYGIIDLEHILAKEN